MIKDNTMKMLLKKWDDGGTVYYATPLYLPKHETDPGKYVCLVFCAKPDNDIKIVGCGIWQVFNAKQFADEYEIEVSTRILHKAIRMLFKT